MENKKVTYLLANDNKFSEKKKFTKHRKKHSNPNSLRKVTLIFEATTPNLHFRH